MSEGKKSGQLSSWSDGDVGKRNSFDWMALKEGKNVVRILNMPAQFYVHNFYEQRKKAKCAIKGCPACKRGFVASSRWVVGVWDVAKGKPCVLDMGPQIFSAIREYFENPKWGNPEEYDIVITRAPEGTTPLYTLQADPKEPVQEAWKSDIRDFLELVDFDKLSAQWEPKQVADKLGFEFDDSESDSTPSGNPASVSSNFSTSLNEEDDLVFE